jgi:hypothetical protein
MRDLSLPVFSLREEGGQGVSEVRRRHVQARQRIGNVEIAAFGRTGDAGDGQHMHLARLHQIGHHLGLEKRGLARARLGVEKHRAPRDQQVRQLPGLVVAAEEPAAVLFAK